MWPHNCTSLSLRSDDPKTQLVCGHWTTLIIHGLSRAELILIYQYLTKYVLALGIETSRFEAKLLCYLKIPGRSFSPVNTGLSKIKYNIKILKYVSQNSPLI